MCAPGFIRYILFIYNHRNDSISMETIKAIIAFYLTDFYNHLQATVNRAFKTTF